MIGRNTLITKVVRDIESGKMLSRRLRWTDLPFARLMGVRFPSVASTTILGSIGAAGAEIVIITTPPINEPIDNAQVLIFWAAWVSVGTGISSITARLRRGTTVSGTQVNVNGLQQGTAGQTQLYTGVYPDNPGVVAGLQYSLTMSAIGATGASTTNDACILAMVL